MATHLTTGKIGEDKAVDWLVSQGHRIVERNFLTKFGEIDIISVDKSGITVFTEVKTIRLPNPKKPSISATEKSFPHSVHTPSCHSCVDNSVNRPENNYTPSKRIRFRRVAQYYANMHPELIDKDRGYRLDLIALTIYDNDVVLNYYPNA